MMLLPGDRTRNDDRARGDDSARQALEAAQAAPAPKLDVDETWVTVGDVPVRIVRPPGATRVLPAVLYLHGGGFVMGNAGTHDRLVRELAVGAHVAIAFVEHEGAFAEAWEQSYAVARWIAARGRFAGLDGARISVAGDEAGGALAAALSATGIPFIHQSLYYPCGLREVADPSRSPETFVVARGDDEGAAYAGRLRAAGVRTTTVTYEGAPPHFMMLNALRASPAATGAVERAIRALRSASHPGRQ
ncbi:esterase [Paractinoplanes deccanensis]|uniref:Esterase n=1 Tax=Paractinoplanes deccanensis TaxID=113561 RepID=A0ABQ3YAY1_9ACTN|nr:alpha/beta hydrolase [Actinoplanes deccanensis]GID77144.1 esterase [Actinoplanes deccanensis]